MLDVMQASVGFQVLTNLFNGDHKSLEGLLDMIFVAAAVATGCEMGRGLIHLWDYLTEIKDIESLLQAGGEGPPRPDRVADKE